MLKSWQQEGDWFTEFLHDQRQYYIAIDKIPNIEVVGNIVLFTKDEKVVAEEGITTIRYDASLTEEELHSIVTAYIDVSILGLDIRHNYESEDDLFSK